MSETLTTALERAAQPKESKTVTDLIARMGPELEKVLPQTIGVERFTRTVLTELRRTPKLYDCDPASLLGAMMLAAQLGLEPGPLGHVYLVPFKREVTFIVGYRGIIELAYRSGRVKEIVARTVYEGERADFDYYETETGTKLRHRPRLDDERGEPCLWYARAKTTAGGVIVTRPLTLADVERTRDRSPAAKSGVSPWTTDFDAMARKTAVRRLAPFLPQSPSLAAALERDETPAPPVLDVGDALDTGPKEGE